MKFSTALALSGATTASAAVFDRDATVEYCPVIVKTIGLSHLELDQFPAADTWSFQEAQSSIGDSKPDPDQVFPNLNYTTGAEPSSSYIADDPYPTGGYSVGNGPSSSSSYIADAPYPTGYPLGNSTASFSISPTGGRASPSASTASTVTATSSTSTASASPSASGTCVTPRVRHEWRKLNNTQRDAYVAGINCLMNKPSSDSSVFKGSRNLFEDLTSVHQQMAGTVHGYGTFLVWHRYFLHIYESLMKDECGYTGPLVWWDETMDSGDFANAPMFTDRWLGELRPAINGRGVCVTESGFGAYEANLGPGEAINNPHCLSRAVDETMTKNTNSEWVDNCNGAQNYDDFRQCSELTYHAYGHNGIGSVMANVATSPEDPAFYLHHSYIDRNLKVWQNGGSTRIFEVGGASPTGGQVVPSDTLSSLGLFPAVTVADVLNTEGDYLCYAYDSE